MKAKMDESRVDAAITALETSKNIIKQSEAYFDHFIAALRMVKAGTFTTEACLQLTNDALSKTPSPAYWQFLRQSADEALAILRDAINEQEDEAS